MTSAQKTYLKKAVEWWVQEGRRGVHHLLDETRISRFVDCGVHLDGGSRITWRVPHVSGASLSEPSPRLSDTGWETQRLYTCSHDDRREWTACTSSSRPQAQKKPVVCRGCACDSSNKNTKRVIAHKFNTGWVVGVVKSVEKKKSVAGQFAVKYKSEAYCWTKKVNKEDCGLDKDWVLLPVLKG